MDQSALAVSGVVVPVALVHRAIRPVLLALAASLALAPESNIDRPILKLLL
jgi:hypothetical protein